MPPGHVWRSAPSLKATLSHFDLGWGDFSELHVFRVPVSGVYLEFSLPRCLILKHNSMKLNITQTIMSLRANISFVHMSVMFLFSFLPVFFFLSAVIDLLL